MRPGYTFSIVEFALCITALHPSAEKRLRNLRRIQMPFEAVCIKTVEYQFLAFIRVTIGVFLHQKAVYIWRDHTFS